jgi:hypothetical protein
VTAAERLKPVNGGEHGDEDDDGHQELDERHAGATSADCGFLSATCHAQSAGNARVAIAMLRRRWRDAWHGFRREGVGCR